MVLVEMGDREGGGGGVLAHMSVDHETNALCSHEVNSSLHGGADERERGGRMSESASHQKESLREFREREGGREGGRWECRAKQRKVC